MEGSRPNEASRGGELFETSVIVTAAHELKSPLALIRQLALGLDTEELSNVEIRTLRNQIVLTSERALRLTTDLTKQARLEDSLFTLEPLNPVSLCDEVALELAPLYRAKGRILQVKKRGKAPLGLANKELLRRILLNFADNALHYSQSNTPVLLRVGTANGGERIRLEVRDYGPAVPAGVWRQLEESLGTDRQVLHSRPESSGLGMYIAGQFAEAMQASLGAIRHHDGASFYVDIHASRQLRLL